MKWRKASWKLRMQFRGGSPEKRQAGAGRFLAPWCGPCKAIAPVVEELSKTLGKDKVAKCNVDTTRHPGKYGIKAIPT